MKTSTHAEKATARTAAHGISRSFVALIVAAVAAIATLLAMACVPQTSLPAAHADTGTSSITVVNAQKGRTYNAYRFATFSDVTAKAGEDSTVASLDVTTVQCPADFTNKEQCWNFRLRTAYDSAKDKHPTLPSLDPAYTDNIAAFLTRLTGDELATVISYLNMPKGAMPDGTVTNTSDAAKDVTISNIPEGWYVVVDTKGARKAVVATTITANGKTYMKFKLDDGTGQSDIKDALGKFYAKDVDSQTKPTKQVYRDAAHKTVQPFGNFSIGDTLYYRVDTHISAHAANYDGYTFVIRDQATRGLTVDDSSVVLTKSDTQDGAETTVPTADYTVTKTTATDGTTTMDVSVKSPKAHAGKFLHLSYSATINSDIVTAGTYTTTKADGTEDAPKTVDANRVENQALIKANEEGKEEWTEDASVVNFTGSITFTKVGVDGQADGLQGATFQVFKGDNATQSDTNKPLTFKKVSDGVYNYNPSSTDPDVVTDVVSGPDGTVTLQGLAAGTTRPGETQQYTLKETSTNVSLGYAQSILALFTVNHVISENGTVTNTVSRYNNNNYLGLASGDANAIKVKNVKNFTQLPLTGAAGVALFTLMALVLGGAAAVLTVKYRRTRQQLDESLAD